MKLEAQGQQRLSRSKVDLFLECPRCFWLDQKMGIKRPSLPGFSLNLAVDFLLKKEFDIHRDKKQAHPLMTTYGIEAIPIDHEELNNWRNNFKGISYFHPKSGLELFGSIDDLWQNSKKEFIVVDYKATATTKAISLEDEYKQGYKKQAEFYQWLLRKKGFKVSDIAYFVFCNGLKDKEAFDGKLEFDLSILAYQGDDAWVEPTILEIKKLLNSKKVPSPSDTCEYCAFTERVSGAK